MRNRRLVQRQFCSGFVSLAFGRFWHGLFRRLKPDLRMCAIAKRLFRGRTAATKRHPFFNWKRVSLRVLQFNRSSNNVRAVLDRLDSYFSHDGSNLNEKCVSRPLPGRCATKRAQSPLLVALNEVEGSLAVV